MQKQRLSLASNVVPEFGAIHCDKGHIARSLKNFGPEYIPERVTFFISLWLDSDWCLWSLDCCVLLSLGAGASGLASAVEFKQRDTRSLYSSRTIDPVESGPIAPKWKMTSLVSRCRSECIHLSITTCGLTCPPTSWLLKVFLSMKVAVVTAAGHAFLITVVSMSTSSDTSSIMNWRLSSSLVAEWNVLRK